jgi:F-type H+-transporting ATPase subunit b
MLIAAVVNVGILLYALFRFGSAPIRDFLVQRSRSIARAIEEAEVRLRKAEAEVERWRERLAGVEGEAAEILRVVGSQADTERQRRVSRARATADRIRQEAEALSGQEVDRARNLLRAEVADLASSGALALLRQTIRPDDDRRLVGEYADRIGAAA